MAISNEGRANGSGTTSRRQQNRDPIQRDPPLPPCGPRHPVQEHESASEDFRNSRGYHAAWPQISCCETGSLDHQVRPQGSGRPPSSHLERAPTTRPNNTDHADPTVRPSHVRPLHSRLSVCTWKLAQRTGRRCPTDRCSTRSREILQLNHRAAIANLPDEACSSVRTRCRPSLAPLRQTRKGSEQSYPATSTSTMGPGGLYNSAYRQAAPRTRFSCRLHMLRLPKPAA